MTGHEGFLVIFVRRRVFLSFGSPFGLRRLALALASFFLLTFRRSISCLGLARYRKAVSVQQHLAIFPALNWGPWSCFSSSFLVLVDEVCNFRRVKLKLCGLTRGSLCDQHGVNN